MNGTKPSLVEREVVVVGSVNVDMMTTVSRHPSPGETVQGKEMRILPGGKGANQALAAARLGAKTRLIGSVGQDANAAVALESLRSAGVDLDGVLGCGTATGMAIVTVDDSGENTTGANAQMDAEAVLKCRDTIAGAAILVVQGEIPPSTTETAIAIATGRVVLNLAPVISLSPDAIRAADPLVVNEHEAALVLRQLKPEMPVPTGHADLTEALAASGPVSVVLTRGARGAMFSEGHGIHSVSSPKVDVADTSGAGDAFVGVLSASLAAGTSLSEAVEFAVRVGAYSVQRFGTQPSYPTSRDELPGVMM
ncbi:ribokinase [Pseudarthrobacter sp. NIBRBAC000502772]|nr:ribokinase [Pseudarthrobacter sp. NIBRBAC000502772]QDG65276.1 ribokinase [Pseudarthrobacter sp. NIBRBAC000502772]